jgi:hypothetical protein
MLMTILLGQAEPLLLGKGRRGRAESEVRCFRKSTDRPLSANARMKDDVRAFRREVSTLTPDNVVRYKLISKGCKMNDPQISENENGYFHLTPDGWTRKDSGPPPANRLETWKYQLERPSPDAKDEVTLTRVWISKDVTEAQSIKLHTRHGEAVDATRERNVILDCHV